MTEPRTDTVAAPEPTRDIGAPVPVLTAARAVFDLSLEGMVWSRRSVLMAVLLGLPIVFALLYRAVLVAKLPPKVSGFDLYAVVIALYYLRNVVPLTALFYATSLIADEVEGKTITYLLSRPISRASILFGKVAAYLVTTLTLTLPAVVVSFFLLVTARGLTGIGAAVPDLFRDMGAIVLCFASYGALFTLMGVALKRPMIPGLLFLLVWELMANLPGYLPRLTLTAYVRSLVRHRPPDEGIAEIFGQVLPLGLSLQVLASVTIVCLAGALWIFQRRQYVLEQ